jgi:AraC family transcriptional regulator
VPNASRSVNCRTAALTNCHIDFARSSHFNLPALPPALYWSFNRVVMFRVINQHTVGEAITHAHENTMVYSWFRELDCPIRSSSFSVKYVMDGDETYTINGVPYHVKTGEYLLVNNQAEGKVQIGSRNDVKGLCINIKPEVIAEVAASRLRPDTTVADLNLGMFLNGADFPESQHSAACTMLGRYIIPIVKQIEQNPHRFTPLNEEQYFALTEALLQDQLPQYHSYTRIFTLKRRTRKHLLQQVWRGKEYIDAHFLDNITIPQIAKEACMSDYHFFRVFKLAMDCTPYQYILQKRLQLAHSLLTSRTMTVSEIAIHTGFADLAAFSKAFKKQFQVSPSFIK